eukprot:1935073-Ditylum_brightwellii.AAC.1
MDVYGGTHPGNAALYHVNSVWLYLKVLTLTDTVDESGAYILNWALTGSRRAITTLNWPYQNKPSLYAWRIWRASLRTNFATSVPQSTCLNKLWHLDQHLGPLMIEKPYTVQRHYYCPILSMLYAFIAPSKFRIYKLSPGSFTLFLPTDTIINEIPTLANVTTAFLIQDKIVLHAHMAFPAP